MKNIEAHLFTLFLIVVICRPASAFETTTARGNGLGQTLLLSQPTPSTLLCAPATRPSLEGVMVEFGVNRKFELKELDQGNMAATFHRHRFAGSLGVSQFGDGDLYAERVLKVAGTYHPDALSLSGSASVMQVDFGGHYDNLSAVAFGAGIGYRRDRILVAVSCEDINSPRLDEHSEEIPPRASLYAELIGPGSYSVTARVTGQKREKPQFGVGQFVDISSFGALFWGVSSAPLIYGGGLELSHKRSIITYATSYHPTLGFSHTLSISFGFGDSKQQ